MRFGLLSLLILSIPLLGCSNKEELSKKDESALRNNFSRNLTPEEIAHMNNAGPAKPSGKGK